MLDTAKPLIKWLNDNAHPHCSLHVEHASVELVEGVCCERTDEFLKD